MQQYLENEDVDVANLLSLWGLTKGLPNRDPYPAPTNTEVDDQGEQIGEDR